jgi:hypothetical protein
METIRGGVMADVPALVPAPQALAFKSFRHPQKRAFLRAFAETGRTTTAAEIAKVHRDSHYYWLRSDENYAAAFEQARQMAGDKAEDEIYRRGIEGFDHPVIYEGEITTTYKAYSDNLAMFFMKGLRPERYRDNQAGIVLQGPTQINITIKGDKNSPDE